MRLESKVGAAGGKARTGAVVAGSLFEV